MPSVSLIAAMAAAAPGPIAAFNVIQLEHAEAVIAAATVTDQPVVMQISENAAKYHGELGPLARACLELASTAPVPAVVHLDHATSREIVEHAVELGVRSVMFDAAELPYAENVAATSEVVRWCHGRGVCVEAELGAIGGKDGDHSAVARTDPDQATAYVEATGIDTLAVAVGSSHAKRKRDSRLDYELIATLAAAVPVPLVLHGGSGVPDTGLVEAVRNGITKVNVATRLNEVLTVAVRQALAADPDQVDPRRWLAPGRSAIRDEAQRLIELLTLPGDMH